MATTFNKIYRKVANNGNSNDYQLVSMIGSDGVPLDIMKGATTTSNGVGGLMPASSTKDTCLLMSDGNYAQDSFKMNLDGTGAHFYFHDNKDDIMTLPVMNKENYEKGYTFGLIDYDTAVKLYQLPKSINITYSPAQIVYHSWNLNANNYRTTAEKKLLKRDSDNLDDPDQFLLTFVNNGYTQTKPFYYPFAELDDDGSGYKRSTFWKIYNANGSLVDAFIPYKKSTYNSMNICGLKCAIEGLYGVYIRYWYRSAANHRRVSFSPWISGTEYACYRGQYTTMIKYREMDSMLFFHHFLVGDTLDISAFPVDTVSSTNCVECGIADVMIYALKWKGQVHVVNS